MIVKLSDDGCQNLFGDWENGLYIDKNMVNLFQRKLVQRAVYVPTSQVPITGTSIVMVSALPASSVTVKETV